jgi:2-(1,2-epoxy-1,2-dihydrophenyl)acetyl-CoA isomerase
MSYEKILYEVTDAVAVITLNDPATLNAMSQKMGAELLDALKRGEREARAILLCGAGRGFCSGANLADNNMDPSDPHRDLGTALDTLFHPIVYQICRMEIPVVSAVRGPAAGIGCSFALAGDIIIASDTAYFLQAFRNIGLSPDGGASYLLSRAVGRVRAMEMMLLGTKIPADKALDWGMITRLVADDALDAAAMKMATELAQGPHALGIIKRVAWGALDATFETALSNERIAQRAAGRSDDFVEGVTAFLQKRPAAFKGK